jgi:hypothetical protein
MQQSNETLFMTSVEKARIRNETLLKVTFQYDCYSSNYFYFTVSSKIES